jgi:hypothetical protein
LPVGGRRSEVRGRWGKSWMLAWLERVAQTLALQRVSGFSLPSPQARCQRVRPRADCLSLDKWRKLG